MPRRRQRRGRKLPPRFPVASVIQYGPDADTVTKIVVGVIPSPDAEPVALRRWVGTKVKTDPKVANRIDEFIRSHGVRTRISAPVVMGCPHEEGEDFPVGEDCPFCPYWKGKQGSGAEVEERWANLRYLYVEYPKRQPPERGAPAEGEAGSQPSG